MIVRGENFRASAQVALHAFRQGTIDSGEVRLSFIRYASTHPATMPPSTLRRASCGLAALLLLPALKLKAEYISEIEPNDTLETAQNVNGFLTLEDNPDIAGKFSPTSTTIPHVSVDGYGDGTSDFYSFSAKTGDRIILDVDYGSNLNSFIRLFDPSGNLVATAAFERAEFGGTGSYQSEAFLQANASVDGTYTVAVDDCCPNPVPSGAFYELQLSVGSPTAPVALTGQTVPESPVGAIFATFGNPIINSQGHVAFQAKLKTGTAGVTSLNDAAIFAEGNFASSGGGGGSGSGSISGSSSGGGPPPYHRNFLIAREGDTAPGTVDGVFTKFNDPVSNFSTFPSYYARFSDGVAFRGTLKIGGSVTKDSDTGIWAFYRGLLELVAREGDQAPGCPAGAVFVSFTALAMPDNAGVAFLAKLKPGAGGVTSANSVGIWATDLDGNLNLVVRRGDTVNIGGISRIVSSIAIFNTASGTAQSRHFANGGELLYRASYQGGVTGLMRYVP